MLKVGLRAALGEPLSKVCKIHILINEVASDNGRDRLEALELILDQLCD